MLKFLVASLLTVNFALANQKQVIEFPVDADADPQFSITRVEIVEHDEIKANYVVEKAGIKDIVMIVDSIIAIGKKVWPIIEAGKPVVNVDMDHSCWCIRCTEYYNHCLASYNDNLLELVGGLFTKQVMYRCRALGHIFYVSSVRK